MRLKRIAALFTFATLASLVAWSAASSEDILTLRRGGQQSVDDLHGRNADGALLDRVCAQKDCRASRLYWFTDLDEAKVAAHRLGRPIVSLHLLGRLDEELSCANSRFFRVMLYSDPAIAELLRDRYVLHWSSVRPVPQVTIDMGDGRKIRQTITGNSVHYLLDANGDVLDALPGLVSPSVFRAQLEEWLTLDRSLLRTYHATRAESAARRALDHGIADIVVSRERRPSALSASRMTGTKSATEMPALGQMSLGARVLLPAQWIEIGEAEIESVVFSAQSLELMRRKQRLTAEALRDLRRTVAIDTVINQYDLHRRIHEWFAMGEVRSLAALDERIYAELFLTPGDDPWLGLNPDGLFTAIPDEVLPSISERESAKIQK
jgi:hypothetical protein